MLEHDALYRAVYGALPAPGNSPWTRAEKETVTQRVVKAIAEAAPSEQNASVPNEADIRSSWAYRVGLGLRSPRR